MPLLDVILLPANFFRFVKGSRFGPKAFAAFGRPFGRPLQMRPALERGFAVSLGTA
jgi:hypothetical protein